MSASIAIALASEAIKNLLDDAFAGMLPVTEVTILPPDQASGDTRRVNLFLFKIVESPYLRNKGWEVSSSNPQQIVPPPLSINLHYLITPYGPNDESLGNVAAQEVLGEAMRVLHQTSIVPDDFLPIGLRDAREQIKITQTHLDLDELSQIWSTFDVPFRLSVAYEISVVQIDQEPDEPTLMAPRVRTIGTPVVDAPFVPPVIHRVEPLTLSAGGVLTVYGENFADWQAYVAISGRTIATALPLDGDSFAVTIPADLGPGFHRLRVDISRLTRATFFVEVTV